LPSRQAFFLPADEGFRFALYTPALAGPARGALLYIHPFGEELNKTRHLVAAQIRLLAGAGFDILQIDLLGCGDSSGDFSEATWERWLEDIDRAIGWLQVRSTAPLWLWGLRAGALLVAEAGRRLTQPCHFLFWQPLVDGNLALQQVLRQAAMAGMLNHGGKGVVAGLKGRLIAGQSVEVGGYMISSDLADGLVQARLKAPVFAGQLVWLDVSNSEISQILPSTAACLAEWEAAGFEVVHRRVNAPIFWQSAELEAAPELMTETLHLLESVN
jgi:uncharacterized protein